jgi:2'-5' RNA ligase
MSRYFLALPLPESVRERLAAARPPKLPGIKLVRPDQMHVTLHFLGELEPHDLHAAKRSLQDIKELRTSFNIAGVGAFPEDRPPRVIWAGIEQNPLLEQLYQKVGETLQQATNFQPEERTFSPHVTLARVKRRLRREQLQDYWDEQRDLRIREIPADRFVLYESLFSDGRMQYREEASWELSR